jgi:hypothetical protein
MAPQRTQETGSDRPVSSTDVTVRNDQINLLALQQPTAEERACDTGASNTVQALKKRVANAHGIDISAETTANGCVYKYGFLNSRDLGIQLTTPANAAGLRQADAVLTQREAAKQEELTKSYGITFGAPGEFIGNTHMVKNGKQVPGPPLLASRMPLNQLLGLEAGLKHSSPDLTPQTGEKPIEFRSSQKDNLEHGLMAALYESPIGHKPPTISLFPLTELTAVTSESSRQNFANLQKLDAILREGNPSAKPLPDSTHFELHSIQQTVEHELAHHAQDRIGWDDPNKSDKFAAAIGWVVDPSLSKGKTHQYMLRGKNNEFYMATRFLSPDAERFWLVLDEKGMMKLGNGGVKVLKEAEVHDLAAVKPPSSYIDSPLEMMAEAISRYRDSAQTRRELLESNAPFYFEAKREDQLDINVTYGVNKLGEPNYIRDLDGQVIPNNPETLKTVAMFEQRVQQLQKK